jgi:type IV pilus assembly protein PilE
MTNATTFSNEDRKMKSYVSTFPGPSARRHAGFTLIELMIVVAVIGIIAGIGYPMYRDQAQKVRRTDAKIALTEIANRLEKFYTLCSTYTDKMALTDKWPQEVGISECNPTNAIAVGVGIGYGTTSPDRYYNLAITDLLGGTTPAALGLGYIITATSTGIQTDDAKCVTFTLNSIGTRASTPAGTDCWK